MFENIILNHWYKKNNILLTFLLLPLSVIFYFIVFFRSKLYKNGILKSYKLKRPVIVIGNLTVGGTGKTPIIIEIATYFKNMGIPVGIIMKGYKSKINSPTIVNKNLDAEIVGDEAKMISQKNFKVAIGNDRYLAGLLLLKHFPEIKIILSDDGLQHYRLKRDYEIIVIDANRLFGNNHLLPMGPLREPIGRLFSANSIIFNGYNKNNKLVNISNKINPKITKIINSKAILKEIYNPINFNIMPINEINNFNIIALCAIGNPEQFFSFLIAQGIKLNKTLAFTDHYFFKNEDIPENYDIILVTEKDYTKLEKFRNDKIWVVNISMELSNNIIYDDLKNLIKDN